MALIAVVLELLFDTMGDEERWLNTSSGNKLVVAVLGELIGVILIETELADELLLLL